MSADVLRARRRLLVLRAAAFVMGLACAAVGAAGFLLSDEIATWLTNWLSS